MVCIVFKIAFAAVFSTDIVNCFFLLYIEGLKQMFEIIKYLCERLLRQTDFHKLLKLEM